MDWGVVFYFLAAVAAAGISYAMWPKHHREQFSLPKTSLTQDTPQEDTARSAA